MDIPWYIPLLKFNIIGMTKRCHASFHIARSVLSYSLVWYNSFALKHVGWKEMLMREL